MKKFNTFIAEAETDVTRQEEIIQELEKLGYNKFYSDAAFRLFVYVPKSDRQFEMNKIADKMARFGAYVAAGDPGPGEAPAKSSLGAIRFKGLPFEGQLITMKPSTEKDLTTDENESLHAYYIACKFNNPTTDYTIDDFNNLPVQTKFSAEELILKASPGWINSATHAAERMYKTRGFRSNKFTICQRSKSKFVTNISKKAKDLLEKAGKDMGLDKWNPADIWLVHPTLLDTNFDQFESVHALNAWIQQHYVSKKLVGVSLKKTDKNVKAEIKNFRSLVKPVSLTKLDIGKKAFTKSKTCTITFNGTNALDIRAFKPMDPAVGELKGRLAAGGKVGTGPMENIVKECVGDTFKLTTKPQIVAAYSKNKIGIYKYALDLAKKFDRTIKMTPEELMQEIENGPAYKNSPKSWLISKIQGMEVITALKTAPKEKVECAIEKVISYAGSTTDVSSVFIKLS